MPSASTSSIQHNALARKRDRDKENQRLKRQREREHVARLEERNAMLEQQLEALRYENEIRNSGFRENTQQLVDKDQTLASRYAQLTSLISKWNEEDDATRRDTPLGTLQPYANGPRAETFAARDASAYDCAPDGRNRPLNEELTTHEVGLGLDGHSWMGQSAAALSSPIQAAYPSKVNGLPYATAGSILQIINADGSPGRPPWQLTLQEPNLPIPSVILSPRRSHPDSNPRLSLSYEDLSLLLSKPEWARPPMADPEATSLLDDPFRNIVERLRRHPEVFADCDPEPKALDLMFGGSLNELANFLKDSVENNPALRVEKFGIAWLLYLYIMWKVSPSEEAYNRIPAFFRPTLLQQLVPHQPTFDCILWPPLRENFIRHAKKYCKAEVFGLLGCTLRIRGSFNGNFVTRSNGMEPQVDPRFLAKIQSIDGWGLLERFWIEYPELIEGMDPELYLIRENQLIEDA